MGARIVVVIGLMVTALAGAVVAERGAGATAVPPDCYNPKTGETLPATQWLTAAGTLTGTGGPDVLVGSAGDDVIKGLAGDDLICSGDGADRVETGPGNDVTYELLTSGGPDIIYGGTGDDFLFNATFAFSEVYGGAGHDRIHGQGYAYGEAGDDYLDVVGFADGGSGNDYVEGEPSTIDILRGGSGDDTVVGFDGSLNADTVEGGSGQDVCTGDATDTIARSCETVNP